MAKNHVHQYVRVEPRKEGSGATYRCVRTGCRHYLREEFIIGQLALCPGCQTTFEITKAIFYPRKVKKVHCPDCKKATFNRATGRVERKREILSTAEVTTLLDDILGISKEEG